MSFFGVMSWFWNLCRFVTLIMKLRNVQLCLSLEKGSELWP